MKIKLLLCFVSLSILLISCGPGRKRSVQQISQLEKQLYNSQSAGFDKPKADSLLLLYEKFVQKYPADSLAPKYLFQAAGLAMTLNQGRKAIELYDEFFRKFPDNPKAPLCLFFKGYIYENAIADYEKAKEIYLQFIEKYPDHEFVKDARAALSNLGKTPEQLVREFELKQKEEQQHKADSLAALNGKNRKVRH